VTGVPRFGKDRDGKGLERTVKGIRRGFGKDRYGPEWKGPVWSQRVWERTCFKVLERPLDGPKGLERPGVQNFRENRRPHRGLERPGVQKFRENRRPPKGLESPGVQNFRENRRPPKGLGDQTLERTGDRTQVWRGPGSSVGQNFGLTNLWW